MNRLERIQQSFTKKTAPIFEIGDTVRVHVKVVEGEKERIQVFEGAVIARKGLLNTETFTVRKVSYGVGVERIFPLHSPIVTRVEVMRQGKVRRAKLYYLRGKKGKFAKVEDREFVASAKGQSGALLADFFSILLVSFPGSADHECQVPFQRTHRGATSWDRPTNLNWKPGGAVIAVSPVWMKPDGALWLALSSRRR